MPLGKGKLYSTPPLAVTQILCIPTQKSYMYAFRHKLHLLSLSLAHSQIVCIPKQLIHIPGTTETSKWLSPLHCTKVYMICRAGSMSCRHLTMPYAMDCTTLCYCHRSPSVTKHSSVLLKTSSNLLFKTPCQSRPRHITLNDAKDAMLMLQCYTHFKTR